MSRSRLLVLWLACCVGSPILLVAMFLQALAGSTSRALNMAVAIDQTGNALFGGDPRMTISTRTGKGLLEGKRWAKVVAPVIDALFGKNHCLSHANDPI